MGIHVTLQSLSDFPDDHGNSMDGALNQESKEPGSKPSTAIDLLCDLRRTTKPPLWAPVALSNRRDGTREVLNPVSFGALTF